MYFSAMLPMAAPTVFLLTGYLKNILKNAPLVFNGFASPIDSVYLAWSFARIITHLFLIWILAVYITGKRTLWDVDVLISAAIIAPLFQVEGYNALHDYYWL
jgi:hypothetical protein